MSSSALPRAPNPRAACDLFRSQLPSVADVPTSLSLDQKARSEHFHMKCLTAAGKAAESSLETLVLECPRIAPALSYLQKNASAFTQEEGLRILQSVSLS